MLKSQQRILKAAKEIFEDSATRVNLVYEKRCGLTVFDLQIDGAVVRTFTTAQALAFVVGYYACSRSREGSHEILPSTLFSNPVITESNLKCNKKS